MVYVPDGYYSGKITVRDVEGRVAVWEFKEGHLLDIRTAPPEEETPAQAARRGFNQAVNPEGG